MKTTRFILLLFLLFFTYSCKESSTEVETKEFLNTLWTLESFDVDGEIIVPPEDQVYNIQFLEDSTFVGKSDCNDIHGEFEIGTKNSLKINKIGTTFVSCSENSLYKEYYKAIYELYSYSIDRNELHLNYGKNLRLNFVSK